MNTEASVSSSDKRLAEYLRKQADLDTLRFITCGSVDDGKSTLIGRLLHEANLLCKDQLDEIRADSQKKSIDSDEIDFSLLVDGLTAEREQGITIDVAYRFFSTAHRKFVVADTPGHEQYTRNMVTGASNVDAAVILVDARKGILPQTKRHSFICSYLGIKHVLLAVNKMDLVEYEKSVFDQITNDFVEVATDLEFLQMNSVPLSALKNVNIVDQSDKMDWYSGPSILEWLEGLNPQRDLDNQPLRFPIQWVNRPDSEFRGFAGTVRAGCLQIGQAVRIQPSGKVAHIKEILLSSSSLPMAKQGRAITITFKEDVDASRGDLITAVNSTCDITEAFQANLVWLNDQPGYKGRSYRLKIGTRTVNARISNIRHKISIHTHEKLIAERIMVNDLCEVNISLDRPVPFDPFEKCVPTGSFILIDRIDNSTVAAGMIKYGLRRSMNVYEQELDINKLARQELNGHKSKLIWFTGLSGSGKSTLANALEKKLHAQGIRTYVLDGDNIRHGLNQDLGFTPADRVENIRRISEVVKLMLDARIVVIAAFISPYRADRATVRRMYDEGDFYEIFVDVPLEVAEERDPKGLYKKAREGKIPNFTGIGSAYERPLSPEIHLNTNEASVTDLITGILSKLDLEL